MGKPNPRWNVTVTSLDYGTSATFRVLTISKKNAGYISEKQLRHARKKLCGHGLLAKCKCAKPEDILRPYIIDPDYQGRGILITRDMPDHVVGGWGLRTGGDDTQVDFGG